MRAIAIALQFSGQQFPFLLNKVRGGGKTMFEVQMVNNKSN